MENITLNLKEEDVKEYLKKYSNYYKDHEALFIKYLKDNKNKVTEEMIEIITKGKITFDNQGELPSFDPRPSTIKNLDINGICHILIPALRYHGNSFSTLHINQLKKHSTSVAKQLSVTFKKIKYEVREAVDDYRISGKIEVKKDKLITYKMNRENAASELLVYEDFYGEDNVKQIRKIISEGVRYYV